jgi:hypothetical protein
MSSFPSPLNRRLGLAAFWLTTGLALYAQAPAQPQNTPPQTPPPSMIVALDQAIELAKKTNPTLQANRTLISQNQEQEVTANLRPNLLLSMDAQYLPLFSPSLWSSNYVDTTAQFDLGAGYLFETRAEAAASSASGQGYHRRHRGTGARCGAHNRWQHGAAICGCPACQVEFGAGDATACQPSTFGRY